MMRSKDRGATCGTPRLEPARRKHSIDRERRAPAATWRGAIYGALGGLGRFPVAVLLGALARPERPRPTRIPRTGSGGGSDRPAVAAPRRAIGEAARDPGRPLPDRKSTRLNSS